MGATWKIKNWAVVILAGCGFSDSQLTSPGDDSRPIPEASVVAESSSDEHKRNIPTDLVIRVRSGTQISTIRDQIQLRTALQLGPVQIEPVFGRSHVNLDTPECVAASTEFHILRFRQQLPLAFQKSLESIGSVTSVESSAQYRLMQHSDAKTTRSTSTAFSQAQAEDLRVVEQIREGDVSRAAHRLIHEFQDVDAGMKLLRSRYRSLTFPLSHHAVTEGVRGTAWALSTLVADSHANKNSTQAQELVVWMILNLPGIGSRFVESPLFDVVVSHVKKLAELPHVESLGSLASLGQVIEASWLESDTELAQFLQSHFPLVAQARLEKGIHLGDPIAKLGLWKGPYDVFQWGLHSATEVFWGRRLLYKRQYQYRVLDLEDRPKDRYDIRAFEAYQFLGNLQNLSPVVVAVVDSGVDYTHPEMAGQIALNSGEMGADFLGRDRSSNSVDDDGNGFVDDWRGFDFATNTNDPMDRNGHGTHVAGTIGARWDAQGISGINPVAKILPVKALNDEGWSSGPAVAQAILYAVQQGARVINLSLGSEIVSELSREVIACARSKDILIVAAAGNDNSFDWHFPSALNEVLSVAATTHNGSRASFSNKGGLVDLAAPGEMILSSVPGATKERHKNLFVDDSLYDSLSGTSMAAPYVAGAASLILSSNPGMSLRELRARLLESATKAPTNRGNTDSAVLDTEFGLGAGILNLEAALKVNPKYLPVLQKTQRKIRWNVAMNPERESLHELSQSIRLDHGSSEAVLDPRVAPGFGNADSAKISVRVPPRMRLDDADSDLGLRISVSGRSSAPFGWYMNLGDQVLGQLRLQVTPHFALWKGSAGDDLVDVPGERRQEVAAHIGGPVLSPFVVQYRSGLASQAPRIVVSTLSASSEGRLSLSRTYSTRWLTVENFHSLLTDWTGPRGEQRLVVPELHPSSLSHADLHDAHALGLGYLDGNGFYHPIELPHWRPSHAVKSDRGRLQDFEGTKKVLGVSAMGNELTVFATMLYPLNREERPWDQSMFSGVKTAWLVKYSPDGRILAKSKESHGLRVSTMGGDPVGLKECNISARHEGIESVVLFHSVHRMGSAHFVKPEIAVFDARLRLVEVYRFDPREKITHWACHGDKIFVSVERPEVGIDETNVGRSLSFEHQVRALEFGGIDLKPLWERNVELGMGTPIELINVQGRPSLIVNIAPYRIGALNPENGELLDGFPVDLPPLRSGARSFPLARAVTADLDANGEEELVIVEASTNAHVISQQGEYLGTWKGDDERLGNPFVYFDQQFHRKRLLVPGRFGLHEVRLDQAATRR